MKPIDLQFEQVSKRYVVRHERAETSGNPVVQRLRALRASSEDFWALRNVSFAVTRGEVLGIIGHNGAGKSTILKLLSSITSPTSGTITIDGRLSALIEVGSGFHPELTGRENIFLNGAILGMRRNEIAAKLDSIAEFAGVQQFLDTPVKRFSSGMYVRLGFAIAAHLDPDILLLDEVLAVGDAAFQEKCLTRIGELRQAGKTIVFISHDLAAVERICTRVILMRRGEIVNTGSPGEMIAEYQRLPGAGIQNVAVSQFDDGTAAIEALTLHDVDGRITPTVRTGSPLVFRVAFTVRAPLEDAAFEIVFSNADSQIISEFSTENSGARLSLEVGDGVLEFTCPEIGLLPGLYYAAVCIKRREEPEAIHWQYGAATLRVDPGKIVRGGFYMTHRWELLEPARADALNESRRAEMPASLAPGRP
jgi:ABC-type polysaccharide/polyol phosphate transport system ATPase subunit